MKEKMCMHTAVRYWQLSKKDYALAEGGGGGGGGRLCKVESLKSEGPISVFVSTYTWYEFAAGREKQSQNLIEKTYS